MEITGLGILSALALVVGLAMGGVPQFGGLTLSLDTRTQQVAFTPIVVLTLESGTGPHGAITLGGTVIHLSYPDCAKVESACMQTRALARWEAYTLRYEYTHVGRWNHFGLAYPLYIADNPCGYDPRIWPGWCANDWPLVPPLESRTGAFIWRY